MNITRRDFLKISAAAVAALGMSEPVLAAFKSIPEIDNPLDFYPDRDWEKIYRDQFKFDYAVHFLCAPNDTHNCLLRGYVKNDIITRIGPTLMSERACDGSQDLRTEESEISDGQGGFKNWADAGFPRDENGRMPEKYRNRGKESFVRVTFEEACDIVAKSMVNIATTYSGKTGEDLLKKQGYDESMIEAMQGAGTQTLKLRGGMAFLGATRIFGMYRFANSLALLDDKIRKTGKEKALGGRGFDSYSWHTDLPPGHTMTCGHQTMDFDLATVENAKLVICWGMNWISTKMPDAHWLTEARLKGTNVVTVACEYQSTSNKADNVIVIRPGSDSAFALGLANIIISENLYDADFVRGHTDMPLLVRMDTLKLLKPQDIIADYKPGELKQGENAPPNTEQDRQITTEKLRNEWGDFVAWNSDTNQTEIVTWDDAATVKNFALEGEFTVDTLDGKKIPVRPVFDMLKEHASYFTPEVVSDLCSVNLDAITWLAREIAKNKSKTLIPVGMGPNHFYNGDLNGRAIFLVCALTKNIGFHGGNIGSFSGNYRGAYFNGLPYYIAEDPFDIELDPAKTPRHRDYYKYESAHYLNYGDRPLRVGDKLFTGKSHLPTPTKFFWFNNGNSILGNLKWHHDFVMNTLPKIECVVVNDWWWTASCEYADIVFAIDSWAELKYPDMTAAVTNPFLSIFPRTSLKKVHDTRSDIEVLAGVGKAMEKITEDARFDDYWKFVNEKKVEVYLQRIIDHSSTLKGYKIEELEANAIEGIPALVMLRTYPKAMGWEQSIDNKPHYTKSGRMEFYRDEDEFIEYGENIPVHREPIDSTIYEPNVIVCGATNLIRPKSPEEYGLSRDDLSCEVRQVRNVIIQPAQVTKTAHPLRKDGFSLVYITPKYRHGAHTTPVDIDLMSLWFGPFGDLSRRDKRMPWVGEGYVDLNPEDAKELGIAEKARRSQGSPCNDACALLHGHSSRHSPFMA